MKVVDQIPMPRARVPQVKQEDFQALLKRIEKLERKVNKKEKQDGDSDE